MGKQWENNGEKHKEIMGKYGFWTWGRRPFYSPSTRLHFSSFTCWNALLLTYNGKRFLKDILLWRQSEKHEKEKVHGDI